MPTKKAPCRCPWLDTSKEDYVRYHDEEWGVPVHDDKVMFEFLILESAQAGLSWYTILRRREGYRKAFANFDAKKVAKFDQAKVEELVLNPEIIRHRGKIEAAIAMPRCFCRSKRNLAAFVTICGPM